MEGEVGWIWSFKPVNLRPRSRSAKQGCQPSREHTFAGRLQLHLLPPPLLAVRDGVSLAGECYCRKFSLPLAVLVIFVGYEGVY